MLSGALRRLSGCSSGCPPGVLVMLSGARRSSPELAGATWRSPELFGDPRSSPGLFGASWRRAHRSS
eukprot:8104334-Alexandrium_andersonii.AAC.1